MPQSEIETLMQLQKETIESLRQLVDSQRVMIEQMTKSHEEQTAQLNHQSVCAAEAFAHLDYILYESLWRWAKRRHPKKGQWWVFTKYWHRRGNQNWIFSSDTKELIRVDHTPIVRHTKVREAANPFLDTEYFKQRKFN